MYKILFLFTIFYNKLNAQVVSDKIFDGVNCHIVIDNFKNIKNTDSVVIIESFYNKYKIVPDMDYKIYSISKLEKYFKNKQYVCFLKEFEFNRSLLINE